jgi:hypothetical protein
MTKNDKTTPPDATINTVSTLRLVRTDVRVLSAPQLAAVAGGTIRKTTYQTSI